MPTKPKQLSLKAKFRSWLRYQLAVSKDQLSDVDQEMEAQRITLILEKVPVAGFEIRDYDLHSLPPEVLMDLARLGLSYKAYERALFRHQKVAAVFEGESPHLEEMYEEFRKADDWYEMSHTAMLRGFVQGIKDEV